MNDGIILGKDIFEWLLSYGYPILIFLSIVDTTYVGFFAGILSSWGVFNPFIIWGIFIVVRLITDSIFFYLAKSGSSFLRRFKLFRKVLKRINEKKNEGEIEWAPLFKEHIFKTLLITKLIPIPGLPEVIIIVGGILKAKYKKVFYGTVIGQGIWAGLVIFLGYEFGGVIQSAKHLIDVIGFITVLIIILFILYYKYARSRIKNRDWFKEIFNGTKLEK
ncbi:MAG: hypothetical protein WC849_00170 [Candidatus Paceibacterota bacterium]